MPPPTLPRLDIQNHADLDWLLANGQQPPTTFNLQLLDLRAVSSSEKEFILGPLPTELVPAFIFFRLGLLQAMNDKKANPESASAKADLKKVDQLRTALWVKIRNAFSVNSDPKKRNATVSVRAGLMVLAVPDWR